MIVGICSSENCVRKLVIEIQNYELLFPYGLTCSVKRLKEVGVASAVFGSLIYFNTSLISNRLFLEFNCRSYNTSEYLSR
jgi:hypothetical protein